ncbi:MAG: c-type cytochrome [Acidobacteriota bacterium]|nr:c-type cytochrome [Acidobacteriota bacterium]
MKRLAISLILTACFAVLAPAQSTGDAEKGKKAFERVICSSCHGHEGQGGAAPRIGVRPLPLAAFMAYVRRPAGTMPAFAPNVLSDAELSDIHAYLSTRRAPPPVKDIPLLNQ